MIKHFCYFMIARIISAANELPKLENDSSLINLFYNVNVICYYNAM